MNSSTKFDILRMLLAICIALGVSFLIIFMVSEQPVLAITKLLTGPLDNQRLFFNVIESMIPLIFTGVGVCIMFSANQINLSGEGSFQIGGLVAAAIALNVSIPAGVSPVVCILLAGVAGSLVTAITAVLKIKTTANELVSSLMINYLVLNFSNYILNYVLRDPTKGSASHIIPDVASLAPLIPGTRVHLGLFVALAVAVLGYVFLYKTKIGYELRLTGQNEKFAKYSGVNIVKVVLISQLVGGFVAGIGGGVEILSPIYSRFTWTALLGYGWDAIIICTLSKKNPIYTPFAAFFLAYLRIGASIMSRSTDVTLEIVFIIQGIIILLAVAEQFLSKYRHKMISREAKANLNIKGVE